MERLGLVSQLEGELERIISSGLLPKNGELPSEQTLAKRYSVSRSTAREALLRLAARGLVVQHPGRRARAVALDEALTLENLGMVLHGEGSLGPERLLLLEGYFSLRREVTVELLSACCEHASQAELDRLGQACFALEDAARWEQDRSKWVTLEFELLRLAAAAAKRPGHLLLLQSLERAFRAMARRVLPCLDSQSISQWARYAMHALADREVQPLRNQLPALLLASDEHVLTALAPTGEAEGLTEALDHGTQAAGGEMPAHAPSTTTQSPEMEQPSETHDPATQAPEVRQPSEAHDSATQALEERQPSKTPEPATPVPEVRQPGEANSTATQVPEVGKPAPEPTGPEVPGARWANLYGCQTGSCEVPPGMPPPVPTSIVPCCRTGGAVLKTSTGPGLLAAPEAHAPPPNSDGVSHAPLPVSPQPDAALPERAHSREDLPRVDPHRGSADQ
jgi:DNA-binding FadR family transcriptional regulator